MPVDPSTLPANLDVLIDYDRPCGACGYNLVGLRLSDRCPECGAPIKRPLSLQLASCDFARWTSDELRTLAWCFRGLAVLALAMPVCAWWWSTTVGRLFPGLAAALTIGLAGVLPWLTWMISRVPPSLEAVMAGGQVTVERPAWWWNVRVMARAASVLPMLAAMPALLLTFGPNASIAPTLEGTRVIFATAASLGTFPLLLLIALFAGEAHDERIEDIARWCLWGLPIGLAIASLAMGGYVRTTGWMPVSVMFGVVVLHIMLCWCCGSLGSAASWAALHAEDDAARSERRERRRMTPLSRRHTRETRRADR